MRLSRVAPPKPAAVHFDRISPDISDNPGNPPQMKTGEVS
jgi:hypothetical protein